MYSKASLLEDKKNLIGGISQALNGFLCFLSLITIFLFPRRFQMSVVENNHERHIKIAIWLFLVYLFWFNFFLYITVWGRNILFEGKNRNPDAYSLLISQMFDHHIMVVLIYLGGFVTSISMLVVSSIA